MPTQTQGEQSRSTPATGSAPGYTINHVMDLLEVPKDRLPICLEELADYLELARVTVSGVNTLGRLMGVKDACKLDGFTWIDDGARDQTLTITPMAESSQNQLR